MDDGDEDHESGQPAQAPHHPSNLPAQELTAKLFYQLLIAEIAGQRDRLNVATTTYLELARSTRDARIAQRATEVALYAKQQKAALEAAMLWAELDPEAAQARQTVTALLVSEGKLDDARPYLEKLIATAGAANQGQVFLHLNGLLARHTDKPAVLKLVQGLAQPYPNMPEAHYAQALAASNAKQTELALTEVHAAGKLKPGWDEAALLEGQILQAADPQKAEAFYKDYLKRNPKARKIQLNFARFLVDQKNFPAAREQFRGILQDSPNDADLTLAVGLLSMQLQDYDSADQYLQKVLTLNYKDPDAIRFYLGQLNEERKRLDKAAEWYGKVQPGEQYVMARIKVATMLARQNKLADGRELLKAVQPQNNQQKVQLILADAQLLRDAKDYRTAFDALSQALETMPDYPDLLYDRAMVSEKMERLDLLEQDLRKVIALKPDHAHAYNALGYTLADRTTRLAEAKELIEKAIALSPSDPFIIDSLGWVQYRMGNLTDAATNLRSAYEKQPDPEIAAHLAEVLWAQGKKDEARKLVQDKLKESPDNEALLVLTKKVN